MLLSGKSSALICRAHECIMGLQQMFVTEVRDEAMVAGQKANAGRH